MRCVAFVLVGLVATSRAHATPTVEASAGGGTVFGMDESTLGYAIGAAIGFDVGSRTSLEATCRGLRWRVPERRYAGDLKDAAYVGTHVFVGGGASFQAVKWLRVSASLGLVHATRTDQIASTSEVHFALAAGGAATVFRSDRHTVEIGAVATIFHDADPLPGSDMVMDLNLMAIYRFH